MSIKTRVEEIRARHEKLETLCKPLVEYIKEYGNPYSKVIITLEDVEFVDVTFGFGFDKED